MGSKLNPIEKSEFIESEFRNYLKDTFSFRDDIYKSIFEKELDNQILYKGPYLNVNLPFISTKSINELIKDDIISPLFINLKSIDFEQKLYHHQEKSLKLIESGRNAIITTGTGSGKTESFLYPIFNSILKDIEKGDNGPGIRAILLYPMNALVNDQIDRVRDILSDYKEIRFGFFTGETPEKETSGLRENLSISAGRDIPVNEVISREAMRNNPPHLLFTNYSMLEYLLIRPSDSKIFSKEFLKYWKFVVLDEAHTYRGALGIEIALLLRRLTGLSDNKIKYILTSATLGQEGRDNAAIVDFAKSLTSSEFSENDIVFSSRKNLDKNNIEYKVEPKLYLEIESLLEDGENLKKLICNKEECNGKELPETLFDFLIKDQNVYELFEILSSKNTKFGEAIEKLKKNGFSENKELVALIRLINIARKDKKNLYDIKYHTFIRTLSGAYVTIMPNKDLKLYPLKQINGLKTFEIGTCKYCNQVFLFGKEINSKLEHNNYIDIYENYGDNISIKVDYYIPANSVSKDEFSFDLVQDNILCGKCGFIYDDSNLNAQPCECGKEYSAKVYKIDSKEHKNYISECPSCSSISNNGIVRSINLGKDEATAILAQTLYKSMNSEEEINDNNKKKLSFLNKDVKITKDNDYVKQFIAFSDSRQQASFFAWFFEYNHIRFLRKRIILEIIKENNYQTIGFDSLVSKLDNIIYRYNLFPDSQMNNNKEAWITALSELLNIDGKYSAEGLGIYHFSLNLDNILNEFSEEDIDVAFGKYKINKKDLENIINVIFNIFRTASAIEYSSSGLTPEERENNLGYRRFNNYIKLKKEKKSKMDNNIKDNDIRSFIPVSTNSSNYRIDYIKKVAKCENDEAFEIAETIFNVIGINGNVFTKSGIKNDDVFQISSSNYVLNNYKNSDYYYCNKCNSITIYNCHDVCPTNKCSGKLITCNPDEIFKDNYYRKEYMNKTIESINIKEHTAQLSKEYAREYQKRFKEKNINILSSSTTFEMGVDLGNLETVFMRNVPPTPANYVQRAGRAGRRDDSSAFVLTFCSSSSHDYTYFEQPEKMILGIISPSQFKVTNEKIIIRHLLATAFGFFFRIKPEFYENIENLVVNGGIEEFKKYINSKPKELNNFISNHILDKEIIDKYENFKWFDLLVNKDNPLANHLDNPLDNFEDSINGLINDFEIEQKIAHDNSDYETANYFKKQIKEINEGNVIENLSRFNIIPKYGFPVDLVNLEVWIDGRVNRNLELNRDLSIALSEYAPDSEVIVDKVKYKSSYITLPNNREFLKNYYYSCTNCERENVSSTKSKLDKCIYCDAENNVEVQKFFIEPRLGFKTGNVDNSKKKPVKSYANYISYLGKRKENTDKIILGKNDDVSVETSTDDELLVLNENPFYMCQICGYAKKFRNRTGMEFQEEKHLNYKGKDCSNTRLYPISLGHKFKTDVARITIKNLKEKNAALSVLYAFLEGVSNTFLIERKDIDGLVIKNDIGEYDLIIFDNVPGGAGHIKRIMNESMLEETLRSAKRKVKQECCDEDTSCYNCLRNYNNQRFHDYLKRKYALEVLNSVLENI